MYLRFAKTLLIHLLTLLHLSVYAQVGKPTKLNAHFDDMLNAFLTVFIIITLDNWTDIMFPLMSVSLLSAPLPSSHTPFAALGK